MNKKQLVELGISEEIADQVIVLHGKDIETHKGKVSTAQAELDAVKGQLVEASAQIDKFKGMKTQEDVDAAVNEWKTKAEQIQQESDAKVLKFKRDAALDRTLEKNHAAKDLLAVKAHLNTDELTFDEKQEAFAGLDEKIKPIKEQYPAYFSDSKPAPQIVAGGNNQSVITDAMVAAARTGAKLPDAK